MRHLSGPCSVAHDRAVNARSVPCVRRSRDVVCQAGTLPGIFERSAWLESLKSRSNRAPVVAGPFRRTALRVPTRFMIVSPTPSSALESWQRTRRPNSSSRAKMVGSGRRTPTGTIRAGEVDAAHNRMRCQRREQRFTMEQTLGLPRIQYGAARFAYVRWSAPNDHNPSHVGRRRLCSMPGLCSSPTT